MGGIDKGLAEFRQLPLMNHVLNQLPAAHFEQRWISANRNIEHYQTLVDQVLADPADHQFSGPLAGVLAALNQLAPHQRLAVAPCDSPFVEFELYQQLHQQLQGTQDSNVAVAADSEGRPQPVFALLRPQAKHAIAAALREGENKIMYAYKNAGVTKVSARDDQWFINLNHLEDLSA